eukprot:TRINITY_DN1762_c0_g2_i1.p1 TRINITY_DN1762_c0_g2~~TRINITY_DN1762_c0_g2_i1.p1  ORF type:complete len:265 (+),score=46.72 TRINITY_DN1762_c0_g2_i1:88-882(+)
MPFDAASFIEWDDAIREQFGLPREESIRRLKNTNNLQELELQRSEDSTTMDYNSSTSTTPTSMISTPLLDLLIPNISVHNSKKLVVVLDLDETLVRFREGPIHWRPHYNTFLDSIKHFCEVVLWTASTKRCASRIMDSLDPEGDRLHHHIYRNDIWFQGVPYTKDLTLLGRNMDKVLIIENTAQCVVKNPSNAILVEDYIEPNESDLHLKAVHDIIVEMAKTSDVQVPKFLRESHLVNDVVYTDLEEGKSMTLHTPAMHHFQTE